MNRDMLRSIVENDLMDRVIDKARSFGKFKTEKSRKSLASTTQSLYDAITKEIKSLGKSEFSEVEKVDGDLVIGSKEHPRVVIISSGVVKEGKVIKGFWVGLDCKLSKDSSVKSKDNGVYRLYSSISKFIDDLKSSQVVDLDTNDVDTEAEEILTGVTEAVVSMPKPKTLQRMLANTLVKDYLDIVVDILNGLQSFSLVLHDEEDIYGPGRVMIDNNGVVISCFNSEMYYLTTNPDNNDIVMYHLNTDLESLVTTEDIASLSKGAIYYDDTDPESMEQVEHAKSEFISRVMLEIKNNQ